MHCQVIIPWSFPKTFEMLELHHVAFRIGTWCSTIPTYTIYLFIKKSLFMFKHFIDLKAKIFEECICCIIYYISWGWIICDKGCSQITRPFIWDKVVPYHISIDDILFTSLGELDIVLRFQKIPNQYIFFKKVHTRLGIYVGIRYIVSVWK